MLEEVLAAALTVQETDLGLLWLCDPAREGLVLCASRGFDATYLQSVAWVPPGGGACGTCYTERRRVVVEDVDVDPMFTADRHLARTAGFRAVHSTPLLTRNGTIIGVLSVHFRQPHRPSERQTHLMDLYAQMAADAIENARLYQVAQEAAVLEERNRLAHDLHDAVTQSLFSASLIAEALHESRNFSTESARQGLEELRQLTRSAQAEMRALLYELDPDGQAEKSLGQLLDQLSTSFTSRSRVPVALKVTGTEQLEPQTREMLYRIAQEALNNIGKHAAASAARVALTCSAEEVLLSIADDGRGFEMSDESPVSAGMGTKSMLKRAAKIGAVLRIESRPGDGTTITVVWRAPIGELAMQQT